MASPILIQATLEEADINRAFGNLEKRGKKAFDAINGYAAESARRLADILGSNTGKQAFDKLSQIRTQAQARDQLAENNHQRKLVEIQARAQAQIEASRERAAQAEQRRIQRLQQQYEGFYGFLRRNASTVREAGESLQNVGFAFTGVSSLLTNLGERATQSAGRIESITRAFTQLDKDNAPRTLDRLRRQADALGTSFTAYAESVSRVRATQKLTTEQSEQLVQGLLNISRAIGATKEQQERAITALNQILAKGKVTAEELRGQLLEAIPNLGPIIEKRFGSLKAEEIEKKFGAKRFVAGLIEEFNKLDKLEPTAFEKYQASLENLQAKLAPLGARILDLLNRNLTPLVAKVEESITAFSRLSVGTQETIVQFGALAIAVGPIIFGLGSIVQLLGSLGNLAVVFGNAINAAGGLAAVMGGLNPIVLGVTAAVIAGGIAWYEYSVRTQQAAASIENAARRASGSIQLLNGEQSRTVNLADGSAVTLLPGRDTSIQLPPGPRVAGATPGFVPVGPNGRPLGSSTPTARISALRGTGGGARGGGGGGGSSLAQELFTQEELAREAIEQSKLLRPQFAALTEEVNRLNNELLSVGGVLTKEIGEIPLQRRIFVLRAEIEKLRNEARGIIDFPETAKLPEFVNLPNPLGNTIPGGRIPTPQALTDAITAASNIPSAPFAEATGFAKGFFDQIESGDQIFERFGQSVSRSLLNVKDLFANLAASVKNLFFDILGNGLQRLVGGALGSLFGGGNRAAGGAGGGGFNLSNIFGGFGGGIGPGGTAVFNGGGGGGGILGSIGSLFGLGGSSPTSLTNGGLPRIPGVSIPPVGGGGAGGGGLLSRIPGGNFLGRLFGGAGGALFPLLGAGIGSSVGGQSSLGRILGGIGGGAVGLGLSYGASVFGALGGGFGALGPAVLAALGPAALIGAPLLLGAFLLGRAKARKQDEATSGEYLTEAIARIRDLTAAAEAGKLTSVGEARKIFESDILATFISQINTIKTKSVRESRLRNQVPDLRNLFEKEVVPAVVAANKAQGRFQNQLPEFATGGFKQGTGYALLHDGEAILNQAQQARLFARAGRDVFADIGVPNAKPAPADNASFATGGIYSAPSSGSPTFVFENLVVTVGEGDATRILEAAVRTPDGKRYIYQTNKDVARNGGI